MSHIFIPYSRKAIGFADKLDKVLVREERLRAAELKSAFEGKL